MSKATQKQTEVNEVQLSKFLDENVTKFLRAVKDDQWSNEDEPVDCAGDCLVQPRRRQERRCEC
jgi:hypothetical protein